MGIYIQTCYTYDYFNFQGMTMSIGLKKVLMTTLIVAVGLSMSACVRKAPVKPKMDATQERKNAIASMSVEEREVAYSSAMKSVGASVKKNPKYKRMNLKAPNDNRQWFKESTYSLWAGSISSRQFVESGLQKYPDNSYEFRFIAANLLAK